MAAPTDQFWRLPLKRICEQVDGSAAGLTSIEAGRRLARFGPNSVAATPHRRLLLKIAKRFAEPLIAILIVAAAISGFTGDIASFCIIVIVIALSIILDVVQEHRAEEAADALKRSVAIHADVRRDGKIVSIPVEQVVPGDVVGLKAGDLVPADGVVLDSRIAHLNEALMTGEPFPTEKRAGPCDATAPAEAFNSLFAGTSMVSGEATMLARYEGAYSASTAVSMGDRSGFAWEQRPVNNWIDNSASRTLPSVKNHPVPGGSGSSSMT